MTAQIPDYRIGSPDAFNTIMGGLQTGMQLRQLGEKKKQEALMLARQQQRQEAMQADLLSLQENVTSEKIDSFRASYPEMEKKFENLYKDWNEDAKLKKAMRSAEIYKMIDSGNIEGAKKALEQQREAAKNSGMNVEVARTSNLLRQYEKNPESAKSALGIEASILSGRKLSDIIGEQEEGYRILTDEEKDSLGLDKTKPFQISPTGKLSAVGGGGVTVNLPGERLIGTIPPGYQAIQQDDGTYRMEVVEGGPVDEKLKEIAAKGVKKEVKKAQEKIVVTDSIDDALKIIEGHTLIQPVAGVAAEAIPKKFNQAYQNLKSKLSTIKASISFKTLMDMKEASKTGSALGSVTENELKLLQSTLGALDQEQSPEQLAKSLRTIRRIMNKHNTYLQKLEKGIKTNVEGEKRVMSLVEKYRRK